MLRSKILIIFLVPLIFAVSCATKAVYYREMNDLVAGQRYAEAAALAEKSKADVYGEKNALLYYLDRGMLLHLAGSYAESNAAFERAKKLSLQFFTKSVTTEASTLLISDNMRPYYGEDFERAMVNVFSAMNYVMLGDEQEALVEARQADQLIKSLQTKYGYKNVYKEDAFVRYLMGMLYENMGEVNDAFISYRLAIDAYGDYLKDYGVPAPRELAGDALRTAEKLGFSDQVRDIRSKLASPALAPVTTGYGELVVVDYNGFSPEKIDDFFEFSFGWGWAYVGEVQSKGEEESQVQQAGAIARSIASEEQVRMAFPKYVAVNYRISGMEVSEAGAAASKGEIADDIGRIAEKNLQDRIARIRIKAIVRSVIKFALARKISQKVEESSGELSGWLAKKLLTAASTATELADKRSWRSLPDKIIVARLALPEGKHSVRLNFFDSNGFTVSSKVLDNIEIKRGKKSFALVRSAQ